MAAELDSKLNTDSQEDRLSITRNLRVIAEAVFAFCIFGGVWGFAGVEPVWELIIGIGIVIIAMLWVARCAIHRRLTLRPDAISFGLSGIVLLSAFQLVPLPVAIVSILSPGSARIHNEYRPAINERLPGEAETSPRSSFIAISVDRELNRRFLAEVTALLIAYTVARNWLASRASFRRLAWAATVTGFLLAIFGFAQYLTSTVNTVFWSYSTQGAVFSTFVCRNHYPFYLVFCLGMAFGTLMQTEKNSHNNYSSRGGSFWGQLTSWFSDVSESPRAICLLVMIGVMFVSILFSLSRGGLLAMLMGLGGSLILAVYHQRKTNTKINPAPLIGLGVGIGVLALLLNWGPVEQRVLTLFNSRALETRLPLWKDGLKLFPSFPMFGTGNGTFERAELSVRTEGTSDTRFVAHSEYLEALVEGGILRFALTLLIAYGSLSVTIRGYRRLRSRNGGWLVFGAFFAIVAVTVHSIADFGLHVPVVALLAAAVLGCASAAANDSDFTPSKRTKHSSTGNTLSEIDYSLEKSTDSTGRVRRSTVALMGPPALAGLLVVVMLSIVVGMEFYRMYRSDELRLAGVAMKYSKEPDRFQRRIEFLSARSSLTPHDGQAYLDLAQAYFDAALNQAPDGDFTKNKVAKDLAIQGLQANRAARNACPLNPQSHFRFGIHHKLMLEAEPAKVYFQRAKKLLPVDPEVWFASGVEAESRDDMPAAISDWKQSLSLSPRQLEPILKLADSRGMTPDQIRTQLMPTNAEVLASTPGILGRIKNWDPETKKTISKPFLDRAIEVVKANPNSGISELLILAQIAEQQGSPNEALIAYRKAYIKDENNQGVRQAFALFLEREELYEELIPHLEWLKDQGRGGPFIRDRIDAANRGAILQKELAR